MSRVGFQLRSIAAALVSVLLLFSRCSFTGGGTEGGNTIRGAFVDDHGKSIGKVHVLLVPSDYNPVIQDDRKLIATVTGVDGSYTFNNVSPGNYSIEAKDSVSGKQSLRTDVAVSEENINLNADTLRSPGFAEVYLPSATGYIYVPGTTISAQTDGLTNHFVISVPPGKIPSICYMATDSQPKVLRYDLQIESQSTMVVVNTEWKYSCRIHLNTTVSGADISGNVLNFPVLIRLTKANFDFQQANAGGSDIRFARSDTIALPYEIERWDEDGGYAEIWVKVDTVYGDDSTQFITMYWGNSSVADSSSSISVFDTSDNFIGVWHLNEVPSTGVASVKDRTSNAYNAIAGGAMTNENSIDGAIGKAISLDGVDDYLDAGNVTISGSYTMGLWVRMNSLNTSQRFIFKDSSYTLWYDKDTASVRMEHMSKTTWWKGLLQDGGKGVSLPQSEWCYLSGTFDGTVMRFYKNGVEVSVTNAITVIPLTASTSLYFGKSWKIDFVNGAMDEIRLEGVARSADWIRLCYMNQRSDDKLTKFKTY